MKIRPAFGRNLNINKDLRKRYDKLQKGFLFKGREAKNIFMISMALGCINKSKKKVDRPVGLLNTNTFSDEDLLFMVAIAVEESNKGLNVLNNVPEIKRIASEYANGGLNYLEDLFNDYGSGENLELAIFKKAKEKLKKK
jgi:hypothetical protein